MASSEEYLNYVLEQLKGLEEISYRKMMGEYIIYYRDKIIGGIYDDRLLLKATETSLKTLGEKAYALPYEGGSRMLIADTDDRDKLCELIEKMSDEIPLKRHKKTSA